MPGPYWCIRLTTGAWNNRLYRLPPKPTTYILHVVSITTHTHDRRKSIGKQKMRKETKIKERKDKKAKNDKKKGKKRKDKKSKKRQDKRRKQ